MTQEEKSLLLKDFCARLPYGVICTDNRHGASKATEIDIESGVIYLFDVDEYVSVEVCRPYLRPMSSMTEKEKVIQRSKMRYVGYFVNHVYYHTLEEFDYLNSIHVDYRGFIEKDLALEAPEGMY